MACPQSESRQRQMIRPKHHVRRLIDGSNSCPPRRLPPPWTVEDIGAAFVVTDSTGQSSAMSITRRSLAGDRRPSCSQKTRRGGVRRISPSCRSCPPLFQGHGNPPNANAVNNDNAAAIARPSQKATACGKPSDLDTPLPPTLALRILECRYKTRQNIRRS
jgi:hypothetical protein